MPIYMPGDSWEPGKFASILAIGDSWFWYPKNNILQAMIEHPDVKDPFRNIQVLGYNGARLSQYVDRENSRGKYAKALKYELSPQQNQYYSAVMVSGGGNDAVDYRLALKKKCQGLTRPEDCMDPDGLDGLLQQLSGALNLLLHDVLWAFDRQGRQVDIFLHGYDYPIPDGRGFDVARFKIAGPWLKPAMDASRVADDAEPRKGICRVLIDALNLALGRFDAPERGIHYIDSRGVLRSDAGYAGDWDNELHPTFSGFKKVVAQRWLPVLKQYGYAT